MKIIAITWNNSEKQCEATKLLKLMKDEKKRAWALFITTMLNLTVNNASATTV